MPAIDPRRLKREAVNAAQASGDPSELVRRCETLLNRHAERTRRPPNTARPEDAVRRFGTPPSVVRTLATAIDREIDADRAARWAAVEALWNAGYRETQQIAAELLGSIDDSAGAERAEAMIAEGANRVTVEALVRRGTRGWREAAPQEFLARARGWLRSEEEDLVRAGLLALGTALDEIPGRELHLVLAALSGHAGRLHGAAHRAYRDLLAELAARSAPECAQYLLDELRKANYDQASCELVRDLLPRFTEPQRTKLERALAVSRS